MILGINEPQRNSLSTLSTCAHDNASNYPCQPCKCSYKNSFLLTTISIRPAVIHKVTTPSMFSFTNYSPFIGNKFTLPGRLTRLPPCEELPSTKPRHSPLPLIKPTKNNILSHPVIAAGNCLCLRPLLCTVRITHPKEEDP